MNWIAYRSNGYSTVLNNRFFTDNLREIAPTADGTHQHSIRHLVQEVGISLMHIVVDDPQEVLGTLAAEQGDGPTAQLVMSRSLSHRSGGFIYTPRVLQIFSESSPDASFQVILG